MRICWLLRKLIRLINNPVSGLPITYNFSDETILKLDADNKLVFLQVDTVVTITASCAGNDYYLDAENIVKTIRLFKGLPTLTLPVAADTIISVKYLVWCGWKAVVLKT